MVEGARVTFFSTTRQLLRVLERERAAHAAERAMLLDRIADLAGRPWTLPPSAMPRPVAPRESNIEQDTLLEQIREIS